jgi:hypothetical protein
VERLYVPLAVTVTCDPFETWYGWSRFMYGGVVIKQVVRGREIAHGSKALTVTCDSVARTYEIDVFPDVGTATAPPSIPFKKGDAIISMELTDMYNSAGATSTGPQTIRLT